MTFKAQPGSKAKDREILLTTVSSKSSLQENLQIAKIFWQMEQDLNRITQTRVHIFLEDEEDEEGADKFDDFKSSNLS